MQAAPVGARCRLVFFFFFLRCSSFPRLLLMRVLPSIEYMLRFYPLLESDGQESLRIRFVLLLVTQDGLSLPVSF